MPSHISPDTKNGSTREVPDSQEEDEEVLEVPDVMDLEGDEHIRPSLQECIEMDTSKLLKMHYEKKGGRE